MCPDPSAVDRSALTMDWRSGISRVPGLCQVHYSDNAFQCRPRNPNSRLIRCYSNRFVGYRILSEIRILLEIGNNSQRLLPAGLMLRGNRNLDKLVVSLKALA